MKHQEHRLERQIQAKAKRLEAWQKREPKPKDSRDSKPSKAEKTRFEYVQHKQVERTKREIANLEAKPKRLAEAKSNRGQGLDN